MKLPTKWAFSSVPPVMADWIVSRNAPDGEVYAGKRRHLPSKLAVLEGVPARDTRKNTEFGRRLASERTVHWITSSARSSSGCGIETPSALAVFRLMTSSNLFTCSTGRSAGKAPLRIFVHECRHVTIGRAQVSAVAEQPARDHMLAPGICHGQPSALHQRVQMGALVKVDGVRDNHDGLRSLPDDLSDGSVQLRLRAGDDVLGTEFQRSACALGRGPVCRIVRAGFVQ